MSGQASTIETIGTLKVAKNGETADLLFADLDVMERSKHALMKRGYEIENDHFGNKVHQSVDDAVRTAQLCCRDSRKENEKCHQHD